MILQRRNDVRTDRDDDVLVYVRDRIHRGNPPTFEEIALAHRCSVRTVIETMRRLKRRRLVDWDPLRPGSVVIQVASDGRIDLP